MSYPFQVMDGPQKIPRPCWGLQVLRISRMPTKQRIALSSSAVVFGAVAMMVYASHGWPTLAMLAGFLAAFGLVVWLFLQVARSRLLGGAVRVSEATLPELQSAF